MPKISKRELELGPLRFNEVLRMAAERKDIISLGPGEPDFEAPAPLMRYAKRVLCDCMHYSPVEGRRDFREAAARKVMKENGINAKPENIIATTGSTEALFLALACSIDPGEHVIVPDPGYFSYAPAVEMLGGHAAPLELAEEEGFELNPDAMRRLVEPGRTKAMILNTPSNPTGAVLGKKKLEEIADIAVEHDLLIISDEAYEHLVYDDAKHISIGSLNGMKDRVVTTFTFSKSFAMPGCRLGYAVAPASLAMAMAKVHTYTTICAPTLSQVVGAWALEKLPKRYIIRMRKEYDRRRKFIFSRLNEMGLATVEPKGAFYCFSRVKELGMTSNEFVSYMLSRAKVAAMPGTDFGKAGEGYVRFSYAIAMPKIKEAMERMEGVLQKMR